MAEPSPNVQVLGLPNNLYSLHSGSAYANSAAGSVAPMTVYINEVRQSTKTANFWSKLMREGESSPICYEHRPNGARGQKVNIKTQGTLGGIGRRGDDLFTARSQMGKIPMAEIEIVLDMISQATGISPLAEEFIGTGGQLQASLPEEIGKWGGRKVCQDIDMTLLHSGSAYSRGIANFRATIASLVSADVPSYNLIAQWSQVLRSQGGKAFKNGTMQNGEPYFSLGWFLPDPVRLSIKVDSNYIAILQNAQVRGPENALFTGNIPMVDGNTIFSRYTPIEQGQVKTGTPFAPIAYLGAAQAYIADPVTTPYAELTGGGLLYDGSTDTPWYADFPGYTYPFSQQTSLTLAASFWGSGPYYALIINPMNAATDPGKIGMIGYTVGTGANTLVITSRLHASGTTGVNDTTVGSVVYGGAVLNSANYTPTYAVNAAVIPCNAKGTPLGVMCGLGADAVGFVRGQAWGDLYKQKVQGGLSGEDLFAGWTYGLKPYQTVSTHTPGIICVACAAYYPQFNLPTVT